MSIDTEALMAQLKNVADPSAKAKEKEVVELVTRLHPDETPLLFFSGTVKGQSKKILLTNCRVFFISSGMFSGIEISDLDIDNIKDVTSRNGLMFGKIEIAQVDNELIKIETPLKESASRFADFYEQLKQGIIPLAGEQPPTGPTNTQINEPTNTSDKSLPLKSAPEQKQETPSKKPGCFTRIVQALELIVLLVIVGSFIFPSNEKEPTSSSTDIPSKQSAPASSSGQIAVNLNTGEVAGDVIPAARKAGSKVFIKADGTVLFKEPELKNSLGELMRGTELRIQEGVDGSSEGLPVRYKVQVMMNGKADKVGWVAEADLANPINLVQNEKTRALAQTSPKHSVDTEQWYAGGTLHDATIREWKKATYKNRLATCADFVVGGQMKGFWHLPIDSMDSVKIFAVALQSAINGGVNGTHKWDNHKVSEAAMAGAILLKWID